MTCASWCERMVSRNLSSATSRMRWNGAISHRSLPTLARTDRCAAWRRDGLAVCARLSADARALQPGVYGAKLAKKKGVMPAKAGIHFALRWLQVAQVK